MTRELMNRLHGRVLQPVEQGALPPGQTINLLQLFENTRDLKPITSESEIEKDIVIEDNGSVKQINQ